jgi:hypothetical protein
MGKSKAKVQTRQRFLREAMRTLGLTCVAFAMRIGALERTLDEWFVTVNTSDSRNS